MNRTKLRIEKLEYDDTTFWGMLNIVGKKELYKNWSCFWAIVFTAFFIVFIWRHGNLSSDLMKFVGSLSGNLIGASAGIFGIVIAALTLTVALFNQNLQPLLLKTGLLHKFLFPFWYAVAMWGINIVLSIFLMLIQSENVTCFLIPTFILNSFLFFYATFYTVSLTGLVIRLALQKAQTKSPS